MNKIIPPFFLVLSLLMFIAGFALLAVERPEPSTELHRARISGDDAYRDLLEEKLRERQILRNSLIGTLFVAGVMSTTVAFLTMRPARSITLRNDQIH